jgi:hypothetical protein
MTEACFIVRNANGQALAYVYFEDEPAGARRRSYSRAMKRGASPPTSPSCLPELGARSAADFERIARDDRQSMVKPFRSIGPDAASFLPKRRRKKNPNGSSAVFPDAECPFRVQTV